MLRDVETFMRKHGHSMNQPIDGSTVDDGQLKVLATEVKNVAVQLERRWWISQDLRALRAHLVAEETAELLDALGRKSRVDALDALCDLLYVTFGCALAFGLPIEEGFAEVHRSNMTKMLSDQRCRDKGDEYEPPRLEAICEQ